MKKEIADKWVAELRSGNYKQGKKRLNKNNTEFCCLGVLCELAIKEGLSLEKTLSYPATDTYKYNGSGGGLPSQVQQWAAMHSSMGFLKESEDSISLYALNDIENYSFDQIADFIEKEYEKL